MNMQIQDLKDFFNKEKTILWSIGILWMILITGYFLTYNPHVQGYKYTLTYNSKNFEKLIQYYPEETLEKEFSKEEIIDFLYEHEEMNGPIKLCSSNLVNFVKGSFKKTNQVTMPLVYKGDYEPSFLNLVQDQRTKKWLVEFPYEPQNVYVMAPAGATVYVGDQKISNQGQDIEIKNKLPGKYQIRIAYHNEIYPDFIKEILVPEETRVDSPYPTYQVAVFAPEDTWVTLGNITKYNSGPSVVFDNILAGQYKLSIAMKDRDIEICSKTVQIDEGYTSIHLETIKGNDHVQRYLKTFFEMFNTEYEQGIKRGDSKFLHMFTGEKADENVISDFKMWYIDQKNITDAQSSMTIRDIEIISGSELKASVLETVYLTNEQQRYRVVIDWHYKLVRHKGKWKIEKRDMIQSSVAYENDGGTWMSY